MAYKSYVGGKYIETTGGDSQIFAKKIIANNSQEKIDVTSGEGIFLGTPDKAPKNDTPMVVDAYFARLQNDKYVKAKGAEVEEEIYLVVKTTGLVGKTIEINILDKDATITKDKYGVLSVLQDNLDKKGEFSTKVRDDDFAIYKLQMKPSKIEKDIKIWRDKIGVTKDKKANLCILVDASSRNPDLKITYLGTNPPSDKTSEKAAKNNYWLDMEGKWFELRNCLCCFNSIDNDGILDHPKIIKNRVVALENGKLNIVNAIILHRTEGSSAKQTLISFETGIGTHFLIEKDGTIYQAASLNQYTSHIGKIKSKCYENNTCSVAETKKIKGYGWSPKKVYDNEKIKNYPERYPLNNDSIGIEVVGRHLTGSTWETIPVLQRDSIVCLVKGLLKRYNLSKTDDIYVHENISYKTEGEGKTVYDAIINLL